MLKQVWKRRLRELRPLFAMPHTAPLAFAMVGGLVIVSAVVLLVGLFRRRKVPAL